MTCQNFEASQYSRSCQSPQVLFSDCFINSALVRLADVALRAPFLLENVSTLCHRQSWLIYQYGLTMKGLTVKQFSTVYRHGYEFTQSLASLYWDIYLPLFIDDVLMRQTWTYLVR